MPQPATIATSAATSARRPDLRMSTPRAEHVGRHADADPPATALPTAGQMRSAEPTPTRSGWEPPCGTVRRAPRSDPVGGHASGRHAQAERADMTIQLPIAEQGLTWAVTRNEQPIPPAERDVILANPGSGSTSPTTWWTSAGPRTAVGTGRGCRPTAPSSCRRQRRCSITHRRTSRDSRRIATRTDRSVRSVPTPTRHGCSARRVGWRSRSCPRSTSWTPSDSSSRSMAHGCLPHPRPASTCGRSCSPRRPSWASARPTRSPTTSSPAPPARTSAAASRR